MTAFRLAYPVDAPAVIVQPFGVNTTGIADFYSQYGLPGHEGVDFRARRGDPVFAAAAGVVLAIRIPGQGGVVADHAYGKHVLVRHIVDGQEWQTQYCHLDSIAQGLFVGMPVSVGKLLGGAGNTGHVVHSGAGNTGHVVHSGAGNTGHVVHSGASDGTHLHFMLRKAGATLRGETNYPNDIVDPEPYLPR